MSKGKGPEWTREEEEQIRDEVLGYVKTVHNPTMWEAAEFAEYVLELRNQNAIYQHMFTMGYSKKKLLELRNGERKIIKRKHKKTVDKKLPAGAASLDTEEIRYWLDECAAIKQNISDARADIASLETDLMDAEAEMRRLIK